MTASLQHLKMRVSENNGTLWTQNQEYIDLCHPAHPQGVSPTDTTQFQVGLARSNIKNLPDVSYQLWPSKEWWDHTKSTKPLPKRDTNGRFIYERTPRSCGPRKLLDFPILKNLDTISSEEDAWFLEVLMRIDGRIEWTDLLMRMEYVGTAQRDEQKFRNRLQQRMARLREKFSMVSWKDTAGENNAIRDRVLNSLSPTQLTARGGLGTTRGFTPGSMDCQNQVIPIPGRRAHRSANTYTQQASVSSDPSNSYATHSAQQRRPAATQYVESSCAATPPIYSSQRVSNAAGRITQHSRPAAVYTEDQYIQQAQYISPYAAPSDNHLSQQYAPHTDPFSGEYMQTIPSNAGLSISRQHYSQNPSSSQGRDSDQDYYETHDHDGTEEADEGKGGKVDDELYEDDESDENAAHVVDDDVVDDDDDDDDEDDDDDNKDNDIPSRPLQQDEIDAYYYRLLAPSTVPQNTTRVPLSPRHRCGGEAPSVFVADLLNPHSRPAVMRPFIPYGIIPGADVLDAGAGDGR